MSFVAQFGGSGSSTGLAAVNKARAAGWSDDLIRQTIQREGLSLGEKAQASLYPVSSTPASTSGPGTWEYSYPIGPGVSFGLPSSFTQSVNLPTSKTYLSPFELDLFGKNLQNSWELNKERELTNLRGQISKELAQLNHVTELGKTSLTGEYTTKNTLLDQWGQNIRAKLNADTQKDITDREARKEYVNNVTSGRNAMLAGALGNFSFG